MATTDILPSESPPAPERGKRLSEGGRPPGAVADRIFRWLALSAGLLVLAILALIAISTTGKALPWFRDQGLFHAVFSDDWDPAKGHFGAGGLLYGTLLVGAIAMILAIPISIGIALFVTEVCPKRAAPADRLHDRPAGRGSVGRVRAVGPQLAVAADARERLHVDLGRDLGDPDHQGPHGVAGRQRAELHDRRHHRRDHGDADRHLARPRGVRDMSRRRRRRPPSPSAPRAGR